MRLCYTCVGLVAAENGTPAYGNATGRGRCERCGRYDGMVFLTSFLASPVTPMPVLKRREPPALTDGAQAFGWSVVLMAVALVVAILLIARCSEGAEPPTHGEWCQKAIRRLPVFHEDNPPGGVAGRTDEKERQLTLIAAEVAKVSAKPPAGWTPRAWAAVLLTVGFHESAFSLRIHQGHCRPHECDHGRARSPWQLHRLRAFWERWDELQGLENTPFQVRAADFMLRMNTGTCGGEQVAALLTAYGGRRCGSDWPGLAARLATFKRLQ